MIPYTVSQENEKLTELASLQIERVTFNLVPPADPIEAHKRLS